MKEFYDYFRYAISMAQLNLPAIVTDNIKGDLYNYIDKMSIEDIEKVENLINTYEIYYKEETYSFQMLDQRISENKDSELISQIFSTELGALSVKQEKLGFIKNFLDNVKDMITIKKESMKSKSRV